MALAAAVLVATSVAVLPAVAELLSVFEPPVVPVSPPLGVVVPSLGCEESLFPCSVVVSSG
ncbi:MAG: hypothetical protein LUG95_02550 [Clostridiales bacterium]|nr:hypothetical protein [Clostridiales bacterium]